jgi:hypothetical protein
LILPGDNQQLLPKARSCGYPIYERTEKEGEEMREASVSSVFYMFCRGFMNNLRI